MTDYTSNLSTRTSRMVAHLRNANSSDHQLLITEDGEVYIAERNYVGGDGTCEREWHNRTLTVTLPDVLDLEALRKVLADGGELSKLIDRVVDGHEVEWDGNNWVGSLTDDAQAALNEIKAYCEGDTFRDGYIYDAGEWLAAMSSRNVLRTYRLSRRSTPKQIEAAAEKIVEAAEEHSGILIQDEVENHLTFLISEQDEDAEEEDRRKEARCRRRLRAQGYLLKRSRSRSPEAPNYGGYMIVDARNNVVAGGGPIAFGMGIDAVEAWLNEEVAA